MHKTQQAYTELRGFCEWKYIIFCIYLRVRGAAAMQVL